MSHVLKWGQISRPPCYRGDFLMYSLMTFFFLEFLIMHSSSIRKSWDGGGGEIGIQYDAAWVHQMEWRRRRSDWRIWADQVCWVQRHIAVVVRSAYFMADCGENYLPAVGSFRVADVDWDRLIQFGRLGIQFSSPRAHYTARICQILGRVFICTSCVPKAYDAGLTVRFVN